MNQLIITGFLLFSSFAFAGINEDLANAEVYNVKEFSSERCDCKNPMYMGRICISSTKYNIPEGALFQDPLPLTAFDAQIENGKFQLKSTAYYQRCTYATSPIIFKDPELQRQFEGYKYIFFEGVDGSEAWMKISYVRPNGVDGYFDPTPGTFVDEKFYGNVGESMEHYQVYYAGKVTFEKPLSEVLSGSQISHILAGAEHTKKMNAWLIMRNKPVTQNAQGSLVGFGEYVISVRFFKKPGVVPRNSRDLSAIGIQVIH